MTGLLTQKPDSQAPNVGSIKRFTWEERTSKNGKAWTKLKNAQEGEGQECEIITVERTDFVDSYGNVSYNVEFEPCKNGAVKAPGASPARSTSKDDYWERKLEHEIAIQSKIIRQHSQSMAIEVLKLKQMLNEITIEDLTPAKLTSLANYFDNDVLEASK